MLDTIDGREFLEVVRPALADADAAQLAQAVKVRWRQVEITRLLRHDQVDVRRVAALTLGLIGDMAATPALTRALRDDDPMVNEMAEHSLWSIWFRAGSDEANRPFQEGVALLTTNAYHEAIDCFHEAVLIDPYFAEAFNQCAIAHFFLAQWRESIEQCKRTVHIAPTHFGAIAGMGHCYAQLGELVQAKRCYQRTLEINPAMPAIEQAIARLGGLDASGEFLVDQFMD